MVRKKLSFLKKVFVVASLLGVFLGLLGAHEKKSISNILHLKKVLGESWDKDYVALQCSDNIFRFKNRLLSYGFILDRGYAVIVRRKNVPMGQIQAFRARGAQSHPTSWSFHMFAVIDGNVFDLDYSMTPEVQTLDKYLKLQFPKAASENYLFQMKRIGELNEKDLSGEFKDMPLLSLSEFLGKI